MKQRKISDWSGIVSAMRNGVKKANLNPLKDVPPVDSTNQLQGWAPALESNSTAVDAIAKKHFIAGITISCNTALFLNLIVPIETKLIEAVRFGTEKPIWTGSVEYASTSVYLLVKARDECLWTSNANQDRIGGQLFDLLLKFGLRDLWTFDPAAGIERMLSVKHLITYEPLLLSSANPGVSTALMMAIQNIGAYGITAEQFSLPSEVLNTFVQVFPLIHRSTTDYLNIVSLSAVAVGAPPHHRQLLNALKVAVTYNRVSILREFALRADPQLEIDLVNPFDPLSLGEPVTLSVPMGRYHDVNQAHKILKEMEKNHVWYHKSLLKIIRSILNDSLIPNLISIVVGYAGRLPKTTTTTKVPVEKLITPPTNPSSIESQDQLKSLGLLFPTARLH